MITAQELGIKTAKTLMAELVLPSGVKFQSSHTNIVDEVPTDGNFFKHQQNGITVEPTKEALLQEMLGDTKSLVAFCCTSLETDTRLTFDIDHVFPRERITEKQKLLLHYLNDSKNTVFTKAFMGEEPKDVGFAQDVGKYFKRDAVGEIKGTKWFYDVCYNDFNNLMHLKHYLNRSKNAQEPKAWFESGFPKIFQDAVVAQGGINEGVIMQQIFPTQSVADNISLGKDSKGNEVIICLHEGKGIGLGGFIRNWFKTNADKVIGDSGKIHEIHVKLTVLLREKLNSGINAETGLQKFILVVAEVLKIAKNYSSRASSPGSDASEEERHSINHDKLLEALNYMHSIKEIKKKVLEAIADSDKETVKKEFYQYCRGQGMERFDPERLEEAKNLLLMEIPKRRNLSVADLKTLLYQIKTCTDPKVKLEQAEKRTEQEKQWREQEKQWREQAEKQTEIEKKARLAAEAELAEMKKRKRDDGTNEPQPPAPGFFK